MKIRITNKSDRCVNFRIRQSPDGIEVDLYNDNTTSVQLASKESTALIEVKRAHRGTTIAMIELLPPITKAPTPNAKS